MTKIMDAMNFWHRLVIVLSIIFVLLVTYVSVFLNIFRTPESTSDFLKNSKSYFYISEIVKEEIRDRYNTSLQNNPVRLAITDALLNYVITPNLVERVSLPALKAQRRLSELPLSISEKNLVLNTNRYTESLSERTASLDLPPAVDDAVNNIIESVPAEINIVNSEENPNSVLFTLTRIKGFFQNLQTLLTVSWIILIMLIITLILMNLGSLKRLVKGFVWIFTASGITVLMFLFLMPWILGFFNSNPDPITGVLKEQLVNSVINYFFQLTTTYGVIYIIAGIIFYLIYRFVPFLRTQNWVNLNILKTKATNKNR